MNNKLQNNQKEKEISSNERKNVNSQNGKEITKTEKFKESEINDAKQQLKANKKEDSLKR